jgi:hypothetical protein
MFLSWLVFPLVLLAVCHGCGLLLRQLSGVAVPGPLVPPLGLAVVILVGELATIGDSTAQLAAPVAVALAVAGLLAGREDGVLAGLDRWAAAAGGAVFAIYAAPIVLSGDPTFAGYVKLDDTATWLAITDRVVEHGRDIEGLAPSSYEATLSFNLTSGYPIGAFLPLGIGSQLVGRDPAWLFQPYVAMLAAMLAFSLYAIAGELVRSRALRAAVAAIAAQPALLFGYYLWGGVKELASAALLALLIPLLAAALDGWRAWRTALPAAVAAAAILAVLSFGGGGVWLLPALGLAAVLAIRRLGPARALRTAAVFAGLLAALSLPWLLTGGFVPRDAGALTDPRELGNLIEPLNVLQGVGIWPVGDFRLDSTDPALTGILIAVVAACALLAGAFVFGERARVTGLFCASLVAGAVVLIVVGSPWIDAKALATASPAVLFAGALGAALLIDRRRPIEGGIVLAAIAIGVLWSNALAYHEEWLAPYDRLAELEDVGERIDGEGPTLMTDYEPYGVRHFLRDADPEGASELRRRTVPLRTGAPLEKAEFADIDQFDLGGLLTYRTLVLRRSPLVSRPPLPFELTSEGDFYEIWQRGADAPAPVEHLPLGTTTAPLARPDCAEVRRLAALPGVAALAAATRPQPLAVELGTLRRPASWPADPTNPGVVYPAGSGSARGRFTLTSGGEAEVWIGGSFRGEVEVLIDGRSVGTARHVIDHTQQLTELGRARLTSGEHGLELRYSEGSPLRPGDGGDPFPLGPVVVAAGTAADDAIERVAVADAASLCDRRLDWIEALAG